VRQIVTIGDELHSPDDYCAVCVRRLVAEDVQSALSAAVDVDRASAARWDAQAEIEVGAFIRAYLDDNPPPRGARLAHDFDKWGLNLARDGIDALRRLGDLQGGE
jgi:hypothetical protein